MSTTKLPSCEWYDAVALTHAFDSNLVYLQPRSSPNMNENEEAPYRVTIEGGIVAIDPDTSAEVQFTIDWDISYATKAGQEAEKILYRE